MSTYAWTPATTPPAATCATRCAVCAIPAQLRLAAQPRTGLRALTVSTRRDALPSIEHAVARDTGILVMLLGEEAAWRLQRCQIAQAVHHAQLDRSISQQIETNVRKVLTGQEEPSRDRSRN